MFHLRRKPHNLSIPRREKGKIASRRSASLIEYIGLLMILMMALLVFQKYIIRGFAGRWKGVGDTFGVGMQYEPGSMGPQTIECAWSEQANAWYNPVCFDTMVESSLQSCIDDCYQDGDWGSCAATREGAQECGYDGGGCCRYVGFFSLRRECKDACLECCRFECRQRCGITAAGACPADEKCAAE